MRMDVRVLSVVVLAGLVALVIGVREADRASLQARYDEWRTTGQVPPAPPAISGATLAIQEAL